MTTATKSRPAKAVRRRGLNDLQKQIAEAETRLDGIPGASLARIVWTTGRQTESIEFEVETCSVIHVLTELGPDGEPVDVIRTPVRDLWPLLAEIQAAKQIPALIAEAVRQNATIDAMAGEAADDIAECLSR